MPCGYELKKGETVYLEFRSPESCPVVGDNIIRLMERLKVRDGEGKLVRDLLRNEDNAC